MSFTINGVDLQAARVTMPAAGVWVADISIAGARTLAIGSAARLVLSDLVMKGTVYSGGEYVAESRYVVVGGAGGWSKTVTRKPYRTDSGVKLSQVFSDLCEAVGETAAADAGTDRSVGYAWTREGGVASMALRDLVGDAWWVAPDGSTHVGARPVTTIPAGLRAALVHYDPRTARALIALPDDRLAPFLPGAIFTDAAIPGGSLAIAAVELLVTPSAVQLEATGTPAAPDLATAIAAALMRKTRFYGRFPYLVDDDSVGRPSLKALEVVDGLPSTINPDQLYLDKAHGFPGGTSQLSPQTVVLVAFRGGDPGAPYVCADYPSTPLPQKVGIDVVTRGEIRMGGPAAVPVALAPQTDNNDEALRAGIVALAASVGKPTPPTCAAPFASAGATKLLGE